MFEWSWRDRMAYPTRIPNTHPHTQAHDVTSQDPRLLVHLKAYRNTVPVPRHWCQKRKYLQGKRGIEKPPFELPGAWRVDRGCRCSACMGVDGSFLL
jgi:hypothetical protein